MEKDRFVEKLLESENLTDELEDSEANWLLDWGVARLDDVLAGIDDPDAAGDQVNALMAVMRKINGITGSYTDKSPQRLVEELTILAELNRKAFGQPSGENLAGDLETRAARLAEMSPREVLEYLASGAGSPKTTG